MPIVSNIVLRPNVRHVNLNLTAICDCRIGEEIRTAAFFEAQSRAANSTRYAIINNDFPRRIDDALEAGTRDER